MVPPVEYWWCGRIPMGRRTCSPPGPIESLLGSLFRGRRQLSNSHKKQFTFVAATGVKTAGCSRSGGTIPIPSRTAANFDRAGVRAAVGQSWRKESRADESVDRRGGGRLDEGISLFHGPPRGIQIMRDSSHNRSKSSCTVASSRATSCFPQNHDLFSP